MSQRNLRGAFLFTGILLIVFWAVASSVNNIDAETNITPTLYVTDLSYLPYVRGLVAGPTATATLPFPTLTPTPTATNTPTATATDTVPTILTAPTLYDIDNSDQDGNFAVAWSAVAGADFYQLMENQNDTGFVEIFKGPELSIDRSNMAPWEYCYNVRARGGSQWSEWAGEKCTSVVSSPELRPTLYDIDNSDQDGNFTVSWSAVEGADFYQLMQNHNDTSLEEIYRGPELSFDRTDMTPGEYCYNVRARSGSSKWSEWAGEKCALVGSEPEDPLNLTATRPNSQNKFTISWPGVISATHFIVEQAHDSSFNSPIQYNTGRDTFLDLQPAPSWQNDFYFRVRAFEGLIGGKWSDTINVVGAYYDEFDDPNSGWEIKRTTNLYHVIFWYEIQNDDDWIMLEIDDKWDWGIASPLAKAPEPPYVIEFDAMFAQTPNEVAMGFVFGGDYPGDECPDKSSAIAFYTHDECFNTFYNPQWYWAGEALHLIWQRVDELVWCPSCGGSPMKRRGDTENLDQMEDVIHDGWNRHRVKVRDGSIKYYAGRPDSTELTLQHEYNDTRYINQPYFGVFAYAGEFTSSVARFENFSITPLDN